MLSTLVKKQLFSFINSSIPNINQSLYLTNKQSLLPEQTLMKDLPRQSEPETKPQVIQSDYSSYSDAAAVASAAASDMSESLEVTEDITELAY